MHNVDVDEQEAAELKQDRIGKYSSRARTLQGRSKTRKKRADEVTIGASARSSTIRDAERYDGYDGECGENVG